MSNRRQRSNEARARRNQTQEALLGNKTETGGVGTSGRARANAETRARAQAQQNAAPLIDRGRAPTSANRAIADTGTTIAELGLVADDFKKAQGVTRANILGNPNATSRLTQSVFGAPKDAVVGASRGANILRGGANMARLGSLTSPLALYTMADLATAAIRDDGRGLSEMGGDAIGGAIGRAMYDRGDGIGDDPGMRALAQEQERREAAGLPALSGPESAAFIKSLNPDAAAPTADVPAAIVNESAQTPATPEVPASVAQAPIPEQAPVPFKTPKTEAEALAPRGEGFTDEQLAAPGTALGAYTLPPLEEGGDPRIMGITRAPTAENPMATQTQEISMEDLNRLEAQQAEQGNPFISGERAPGLKPFIDASGNVAYADANTAERMNALEGQRRQEDRAAQQKFLQSDAAREMSNRQLQRVQQGGSFAQASRDREARLAAKPDFNEVRRGTASVGKDGLTDAQRRKAYPDPAMRAQSKAGLLGNIVEQKQLELDALKSAERDDPTKFEYNKQVVMDIVNNLPAINPDTVTEENPNGRPYTAQEKQDIYRQYMYEIAIQRPMFDKYGDRIEGAQVIGFGGPKVIETKEDQNNQS